MEEAAGTRSHPPKSCSIGPLSKHTGETIVHTRHEMNTRSKGPIVDSANNKPYKTNINSEGANKTDIVPEIKSQGTNIADIVLETVSMSSTTPDNTNEMDLKSLTSDQNWIFSFKLSQSLQISQQI